MEIDGFCCCCCSVFCFGLVFLARGEGGGGAGAENDCFPSQLLACFLHLVRVSRANAVIILSLWFTVWILKKWTTWDNLNPVASKELFPYLWTTHSCSRSQRPSAQPSCHWAEKGRGSKCARLISSFFQNSKARITFWCLIPCSLFSYITSDVHLPGHQIFGPHKVFTDIYRERRLLFKRVASLCWQQFLLAMSLCCHLIFLHDFWIDM